MKYLKTTVYPLQVQFEDIDAGGAVHNPNYLKYFERARNAVLADNEYPMSELIKEGFALVLGETYIKYVRPALMDQKLFILSRITNASRIALKVEQVIVNKEITQDLEALENDLTKIDGLITVCKTKIVFADLKRMRPSKFNEKLTKIFELPEAPEEGRDNVEIL